MAFGNQQKRSGAKVHLKQYKKNISIFLVVIRHRFPTISQKLPVPTQWVKIISTGRYDLREFNQVGFGSKPLVEYF
jgi:hypothetical protein